MQAEKRRTGRAIRKRRRTRARIATFARSLGYELHPWQLDYLTTLQLGTPHYPARARRGGKAAVVEVWRGLQAEHVIVDEARLVVSR